jgi:hypothetical protein
MHGTHKALATSLLPVPKPKRKAAKEPITCGEGRQRSAHG